MQHVCTYWNDSCQSALKVVSVWLLFVKAIFSSRRMCAGCALSGYFCECILVTDFLLYSVWGQALQGALKPPWWVSDLVLTGSWPEWAKSSCNNLPLVRSTALNITLKNIFLVSAMSVFYIACPWPTPVFLSMKFW